MPYVLDPKNNYLELGQILDITCLQCSIRFTEKHEYLRKIFTLPQCLLGHQEEENYKQRVKCRYKGSKRENL